MYRLLIFLVTLCVHTLRAIFRTRGELLIENLALRQQVATLKKERPRPVLDDVDRAFWVALRDAWPGWVSRLALPFTHKPCDNLHSCPADTHRKGLEDRHTPSTLSDAPEVDLSCVPDSHQARLQVGQSLPVVWVGQCFFYCMSTQYSDLDI